MGTGAPIGARRRGLGLGWEQVANALAQQVHVAEIDRIWLFAPVRQEGREWGTAVVLLRLGEGRHRVYTATYMVTTRGPERGSTKVSIDEIGDSPSVVVEDVIAGVQERSGDAEAPTEVAPQEWFVENGADQVAASEGDESEQVDSPAADVAPDQGDPG